MTGVTIMRMEAGLDTGPILLQKCLPIQNGTIFCDNTQSLLETLAVDGAKLMISALNMLRENRTSYITQNEEQATYAPKLTKLEAIINWDLYALKIHNHVRGFSPNPGATTTLKIDNKEPIAVRIEEGFYFHKDNLEKEEYASFQECIIQLEIECLRKAQVASIKNGQLIGMYKKYLLVKTQESYYAVSKIRLAGKTQMDAKAFINGYFKNYNCLYFY